MQKSVFHHAVVGVSEVISKLLSIDIHIWSKTVHIITLHCSGCDVHVNHKSD